MDFAFFESRPGTGCRIGAISCGRGRVDRKMGGEWIKSRKGQRQRRKKNPEEDTHDQYLEMGFRSHAKGQTINLEGQKSAITGRKECGVRILKCNKQKPERGIKKESNGDDSAVAHFSFKNLLINFWVFCFLVSNKLLRHTGKSVYLHRPLVPGPLCGALWLH